MYRLPDSENSAKVGAHYAARYQVIRRAYESKAFSAAFANHYFDLACIPRQY
jgi:hypothetical protein